MLGEHVTGPRTPLAPEADASASVPSQVLMLAGASLCLISLLALFLFSIPCASVTAGFTGLMGGLVGLTLTRGVLATSPPHPWEPPTDRGLSDVSRPHGLTQINGAHPVVAIHIKPSQIVIHDGGIRVPEIQPQGRPPS